MKLKHMFRQHTFRNVLFAFLALSWNAAGQAALMRYEYGGTITSADPSTGITPGTRFSGTFTYNPADNADAMMIEGQTGYSFGLSTWPGSQADGSGITLQIGGKSVLSDPGGVSITVTENEYPNQFSYLNGVGPATALTISNPWTDSRSILVGLDLSNPSRSVFHSLDPPTSLDLSDFPVAQLSGISTRLGTGGETLFSGTIDTLTQAPVPEPAWATVLCLAAVGWIARSSRRN